MFNLKTTEVIDNYVHCNGGYSGPAVKLGAGIAGYEALEAVHSAGYRILTGDCSTVGVTGGYTQGGGHSALINQYGMAADQVLEWELVTANGEHLIATPTENIDLYWALSGGGAGTFGVVLSMTVKIYPEGPVGTAFLSFNGSSVDDTTYLTAVESWWTALPGILDTGVTPVWVVSSQGFIMQSLTALNKTASETNEILQPFLSRLDALGIPFTFTAEELPSYFDVYDQTLGPLPFGPFPGSMLFNSRFVPRTIVDNNASVSKLTATMNTIVNDTSIAQWEFGCSGFNVQKVDHPDNAVAPYWRDAIAMCITVSFWDWTIPFDAMTARRQFMADTITPAMESATPNGGAYLNEADPLVYPLGSTDWIDTFYGSNYPKLRQIKALRDPDSIFYARTAVGSEDWVIDDDGRLCPA